MRIDLNNFSNWQDDKIRRLVSSIAKELRLKADVRFIFQTTWTDIEEDGNIRPGTEAEVGFDADAYDNGVVRICIDKTMEFPFTYDINDRLDGFYLRHVVQFTNAYEMLLYMTAHELRHLYQWENPVKATQVRRLLKCDDETDADIYATMTLSRYRSGKR